jgi:hypothetical protein
LSPQLTQHLVALATQLRRRICLDLFGPGLCIGLNFGGGLLGLLVGLRADLLRFGARAIQNLLPLGFRIGACRLGLAVTGP